jgi:aldose 1-epimerase
MGFQIHTRGQALPQGKESEVYVLAGDRCRIEVCPALGFNCFSWLAVLGSKLLDLLYCDPNFFVDGRPTRSGIPILFPFPNRLRDGRFTFGGRDYQLPLNDSAGKNAIHGFACRYPWRVESTQADAHEAVIRGVFQPSLDAPEVRGLWPADYRIHATYRLTPTRLQLEIAIDNPDTVPLPFGLGFHPYFRVPFLPGTSPDLCMVEVPARACWELEDSLPTGETRPVDTRRDLNNPRPFSGLQLDDLLTGLPPSAEGALRWNGLLRQEPENVALSLASSPDFREMVVFTPPHRQAFCIEPYTCPTDAPHLQERGLETGWRSLAPGASWRGVIELTIEQM